MTKSSTVDLLNTLGLGVVGNFAGHLEQAGESKEFNAHHPIEREVPKGLFPFYIPGYPTKKVGEFPYSSDKIVLPKEPCQLQFEAEVGLYCDIVYDGQLVKNVIPRMFTVFNDCSIRINDGRKLSEKKNWGVGSKGVGAPWVELQGPLNPGCLLDAYSLIAYIKRDAVLHQAIPVSPVVEYSYFHQELLDWVVHQLNSQPETIPLESLPWVLEVAHYPKTLLLSVGATRYTEFGSSNYLKLGDEVLLSLFNHQELSLSEVTELVGRGVPSKNCLLLRQQLSVI